MDDSNIRTSSRASVLEAHRDSRPCARPHFYVGDGMGRTCRGCFAARSSSPGCAARARCFNEDDAARRRVGRLADDGHDVLLRLGL